YMRVDEAHHVLGLRLNVWTAIIVFVLAVVYIVISAKLRPGREEIVEPDKDAEAAKKDDDADAADQDGDPLKKDTPEADSEADSADKDPLKKDSAPEAADKS
ncbi:prolipoprotein diacylglyceryl transferase, partial [Streptomyces sp. SID8455]|nr:prolipoprotein diacylglyceryl transferase [Streptomyces sp. SID8455]